LFAGVLEILDNLLFSRIFLICCLYIWNKKQIIFL